MGVYKNDEVMFNKCIKQNTVYGKVVDVFNKGTPTEYYLVKTSDGDLSSVKKEDILSSKLMIRAKKVSKPKSKKGAK